jgi:TPR repeat protein
MPTDYAYALSEFLRFAEQGDAQAQFNLGVMYGLGLGVAQDYTEALAWYERAADAGNARAQSNLGWMFGTGRGVPQDYVAAHAWYSLAAAKGEDMARQNRELLSTRMTPSQVEKAQDLAKALAHAERSPDDALGSPSFEDLGPESG